MTKTIAIAERAIGVAPRVPPCELRIERPIAGDPAGRREYICGAPGLRLAVVGEASDVMGRICNACDLPEVLAHDPRICLHLRPVRVIEPDATATTCYACRWFYRFNPHHQPTSINRCSGCPYWFPRPSIQLLAQHRSWGETEEIRAAMTNPTGPPPRFHFPPPQESSERFGGSWWRRFWAGCGVRSSAMPIGSGWPVKVTTIDEVPHPMGGQLAEQLARGETPQQLVYVPADPAARRAGQWERTRGVQVLALTDQRLIVGVQAVRRGEAPWIAIPYDAIVTWEIGEILLYGRLDLCADLGGQVVRTYIEFNTVGTHLIVEALAPLERVVLGVARQSGLRQRGPTVTGLPFKFGNFLADALLPGEVVCDLVFQEAVVVPLFRFWRRLVTPGTVIAGTDRRLLVIREEAKVRDDRYGHSTITLPRRWVHDLAIHDDGTWLTLAETQHAGVLRLPVARMRAAALYALVTALQSEAAAPQHDGCAGQAVRIG